MGIDVNISYFIFIMSVCVLVCEFLYFGLCACVFVCLCVIKGVHCVLLSVCMFVCALCACLYLCMCVCVCIM